MQELFTKAVIEESVYSTTTVFANQEFLPAVPFPSSTKLCTKHTSYHQEKCGNILILLANFLHLAMRQNRSGVYHGVSPTQGLHAFETTRGDRNDSYITFTPTHSVDLILSGTFSRLQTIFDTTARKESWSAVPRMPAHGGHRLKMIFHGKSRRPPTG